MPPERSRSRNAQGRQKSCSECVKAKRRCDLQQPHCLRCTKQKLTCSYPQQPYTSATPLSPAFNESSLEGIYYCDEIVEPPLDLAVSGVSSAPAVELFDMGAVELAEPLNSLQDTGTTMQSLTESAAVDRLLSSGPFSDFVSELFESRLGYTLEQWKLAPGMMVEKLCTPWCHPNLYNEVMPRSIQDVIAACSLYSNRSDVNAKFVQRYTSERVQELMESPMPTTPLEVVARAHALLLYQIMLITSGDFRYYYQTEAILPQLNDLLNILHTIVVEDESKNQDFAGVLPLYPSSVARSAWLSFIFRETCRRTLYFVCHAVTISTLLQNQMSACHDHLAEGSRIILSTTLWEANSPLEFALAWNKEDHFLVKELDFGDMLKRADAGDIDVFGRMMMVGLMGTDDVKGWLHSKGAKL